MDTPNFSPVKVSCYLNKMTRKRSRKADKLIIEMVRVATVLKLEATILEAAVRSIAIKIEGPKNKGING